MSELPKRELALLGAACAVCCAPLVIGARDGATPRRPSGRHSRVPELVRALALFALAGLGEIGGG